MNTSLNPSNRPLKIDTTLEPDTFLPIRMEAEEGLSELFRYRLELVALRRPKAVPIHELLGQPVAIHLTGGSAERHFHGIVRQVAELEQRREPDFHYFEAEVVPTLWLWTQRVRSRVFQHQSVPDILKAVLSELRPDVEFQLQSNYPVRNYVVQYQESDFAFISRLMEEEGISYYFRHEPLAEAGQPSAGRHGKAFDYRHVLVLVDRTMMFPLLRPSANLRFDDASEAGSSAGRVFFWKMTQQVRRQVFTLRDQHFALAGNDARRPLRTLQAARSVGESVPVGRESRPLRIKPLKSDAEPLERYEHNSGFARRFDGNQLGDIFTEQNRQAQLRQEEDTASAISVEGRASYTHLVPGCRFNVSNLDAKDGTYLLTRVVQTVTQPGPRSTEGELFTHNCHFSCVPEALPVRPARKTPRPRIEGMQTAVVAGVSDQGIYVDAFGRVKVQFYWDRSDQYNENSSCWVRVSQLWAGNRWGAFFWPRPGMEVIVSFEDGDPDRPLITGCVYNAANMPPANLPAESAIAGFKSCSSDSNVGPNNALVFYDLPGDEHVFQHSPSDEARITRGTSYRCSVGPDLEFTGGSLLPSGSGSGGGLGAIAMAFSENSFKQGLTGATPTSLALGLLNALVPAKASYSTGSSLGTTITGTKTAHSLFTRSASYSISDDFEAIGSALGFKVPPAVTLLSRIIAGGSLLPPSVSLSMFSNSLKQDYWGGSYSVERKGKDVKHVGGPLIKTELGKSKGAAKKPNEQYQAVWVAGVWTSLGLLGALLTAVDVFVVILNRKWSALDADIKANTGTDDASKQAKTAKTAEQNTYTMVLQILALGSQVVVPILHFVIYKLETVYAELQAARTKFKQVTDELETVTKLIASFDMPALKDRKTELEDMLSRAKTAAGVATNNMMDITRSARETMDSELDGYVQKDYVAGLSVAGPTIDIMAMQALDDQQQPKPSTGKINLLALGEITNGQSTRAGTISLKSDGSLGLEVRTATMGLNGKADAGKAQAYITVGKDDEIKLTKSTGGARIAPLEVTMTGSAIELKAGDPLTGCSSIKIEPDGITFSSGPAATAATMKITASEITSKLGVTTVSQSMQDLQRKVATTEEKVEAAGTKLQTMTQKFMPQLISTVKTTLASHEAQIQKLQETMTQIGS